MSRKGDGYYQRAQKGRMLPEPRCGNKVPVRGYRRLDFAELKRLWMREHHIEAN